MDQIKYSLEKLKNERDGPGWGEPDRFPVGMNTDVKELVKQLDIDQKFCEFGGLVEELTSKIDKKLDRVCDEKEKETDALDTIKRPKRLETLSSAHVDNSLKTFKTVQAIDKRG